MKASFEGGRKGREFLSKGKGRISKKGKGKVAKKALERPPTARRRGRKGEGRKKKGGTTIPTCGGAMLPAHLEEEGERERSRAPMLRKAKERRGVFNLYLLSKGMPSFILLPGKEGGGGGEASDTTPAGRGEERKEKGCSFSEKKKNAPPPSSAEKGGRK